MKVLFREVLIIIKVNLCDRNQSKILPLLGLSLIKSDFFCDSPQNLYQNGLKLKWSECAAGHQSMRLNCSACDSIMTQWYVINIQDRECNNIPLLDCNCEQICLHYLCNCRYGNSLLLTSYNNQLILENFVRSWKVDWDTLEVCLFVCHTCYNCTKA